MRHLQILGALVLAAVATTFRAQAGDEPPSSGDEKTEPDVEKKAEPEEEAPKDQGDEKKAPKDEAGKKKSAPKDEGDEEQAPEEKAPKDEANKKKAASEEAPAEGEEPEEKKPPTKKPKDKQPDEAEPGEKKPKDNKTKGKAPKEKRPAPVAPRVTLGEPAFMGGEVKLVTKMLNKTLPKVAACVKGADGLDGKKGYIKVQFLVRVRGRAEGVEVLGRRGVSKKAAKCVQKMLKNRWVGTPSNDPVGVTVRYNLAVRK